jgi:glycosyltransferase involved in cell wall biosynthesis
MPSPTVTVICLCHNQGRFVKEAIESVRTQTYPNIQLLVVDDASTDNSVAIIKACLDTIPSARFFPLSQNMGNCKAFNHALKYADGDFFIDLAADDVLLPDRISEGVKALMAAGKDYGVNFTDAYRVAEDGKVLSRHSDTFPPQTIPEGDIYRELIARYFICSPTMMFRADVIRALAGYDDSLAYEDFDFWIRSSRNFSYCYTPQVLVKKRIVKDSMSARQFSLFDRQLESTFRVCEKILTLNRSADEQKALRQRILYEMRVCVRLLRVRLLIKYTWLLMRNSAMRY